MLRNEYKNNRRFRDYVDRYCKNYGYTLEEALKHELIRLYYLEVVKDGENEDKRYHAYERTTVFFEIHQAI